MNIFPETPQALLKKIAELSNGADEIVWKELIELYAPALRLFVRLRDSNLPDADVEDVVQEVFIKLVRGAAPSGVRQCARKIPRVPRRDGAPNSGRLVPAADVAAGHGCGRCDRRT